MLGYNFSKMSRDLRSSSSRKGSATADAVIPVENFAIYLLEALQDVSVSEQLKKVISVNHERIADMVTARMDAKLQHLKDDLEAKETRIKELENEVEMLKLKADDQEQYSRRTSVRFYGIPEADDEDPNHPESAIQDILSKVGLTPVIQRCHRVGPKKRLTDAASSHATPRRPQHRAVICQFSGQKDKRDTMAKWKAIRDNCHGVTVNEDLTRIRAQLAFSSRELKRKRKIKDTWTADGKVLVKDNSNRITMIRSMTDLLKF